MSHLQSLALGTKEIGTFDPHDLPQYLDLLAATQTITWLVWTNIPGFYSVNIFNHIPATVQRLDFYDCVPSGYAVANWLAGDPNRQSSSNNDWIYTTGMMVLFPPPRSFFVTHEPRYGT